MTGYALALRDIERMHSHWKNVHAKRLAYVRHIAYCAWLGFIAPLIWTKTGREYNRTMRYYSAKR